MFHVALERSDPQINPPDVHPKTGQAAAVVSPGPRYAKLVVLAPARPLLAY